MGAFLHGPNRRVTGKEPAAGATRFVGGAESSEGTGLEQPGTGSALASPMSVIFVTEPC
jgi:hypothetical protein